MKKTLFILLILFSYLPSSYGFFTIEPYITFGMGSIDFDEVMSPTETLDHNNTIYHGGAGARIGFKLSSFLFGTVGEYYKEHWDGSRADGRISLFESRGYDNTYMDAIFGGYAGYRFENGWKIWGEYYPDVRGKFSYSDTDSANPFEMNDHLEGSGFAIGLGHIIGNIFSTNLVYRHIIFDKFESSSGTVSLPSDRFSRIDTAVFMFQAGIFLDL